MFDKLIVLVSANGIVFVVVGLILGGMAHLGGVVDESYFIGQGTDWINVSRFVYIYSLWHGRITAVSLFAMILLGLIDHVMKNRNRNSES